MRRGLTIAAAFLAGCTGGEEASAPERGGVAGVQTTKGLVAAPVQEGGFADAREVRWLGRLADWSAEFARAGRAVAAFEERDARFARAVDGDAAAIAAYADVLRPIRGCRATFRDRVGRAPSERLRESERGFLASCGDYRRGVGLMLEALREQDEDRAERARRTIERAGERAAVAAGLLPPGEKQALPVRAGETDESRVEPRFSRVAARLAEKDVEVRCWSRDDWERLLVEEKAFTAGKVNEQVLGFASAGGQRLNLAPPICEALVDLVYADARPAGKDERLRLALGVETLAHESMHLAGTVDEPTAECYGIQWVDDAAIDLGVEEAFARRLQASYWGAYDRLPAAYRSAECRDGGDLDLDPEGESFP